MEQYIDIPTMGEILVEDFLEPVNMSIEELAKQADIDMLVIEDIIYNQGRITIELSQKIGRIFHVSDQYLLNIQNDIDVRWLERRMNSLYFDYDESIGQLSHNHLIFCDTNMSKNDNYIEDYSLQKNILVA